MRLRSVYFVWYGKFYPLIEHYGYLVVLFGTTGIPFPSAAILLAAGVLVQQGHLDLREATLFGILGAIIGFLVGLVSRMILAMAGIHYRHYSTRDIE